MQKQGEEKMSDSKDEKEKVRRRVRLHMYKALTAGAVGSIVFGSAVSGCQSQSQTPDRDPRNFPVVICDPMPPPVRSHQLPKTTIQSTTVQFDFGKSTLNKFGKAKLDEMLTQLKELHPEVAVVTGHADRIGAKAGNQKLSERRAAAVSAYLISKGFESNRIYTEGKGSKSPATMPNECDGPKNTKVIDCLQPDRRVEIEIIGKR